MTLISQEFSIMDALLIMGFMILCLIAAAIVTGTIDQRKNEKSLVIMRKLIIDLEKDPQLVRIPSAELPGSGKWIVTFVFRDLAAPPDDNHPQDSSPSVIQLVQYDGKIRLQYYSERSLRIVRASAYTVCRDGFDDGTFEVVSLKPTFHPI